MQVGAIAYSLRHAALSRRIRRELTGSKSRFQTDNCEARMRFAEDGWLRQRPNPTNKIYLQKRDAPASHGHTSREYWQIRYKIGQVQRIQSLDKQGKRIADELWGLAGQR